MMIATSPGTRKLRLRNSLLNHTRCCICTGASNFWPRSLCIMFQPTTPRALHVAGNDARCVRIHTVDDELDWCAVTCRSVRPKSLGSTTMALTRAGHHGLLSLARAG
jgi:hypothetical protein